MQSTAEDQDSQSLAMYMSLPKQDTTTIKVKVQQWRCDVCQVAMFSDFDEACRHEANCQQPPPPPPALPAVQEQQQPPHEPESSSAPAAVVEEAPSLQVTPKSENSKKKKKKKKSTTSNNANANVHSFFAPRKVAKRPSPTATTTSSASASASKGRLPFFHSQSNKKSKTTNTDSVDKEGQPPPIKTSSSGSTDEDSGKAVRRTKRKSPTASSTSSTVPTTTMESLEETAHALAAMMDKQSNKTLAGMFCHKDMKTLIAEQRQAQFQAELRHKRKQEQERQLRRAAAAAKWAGTTTTTSTTTTTNVPLPLHCRLPMAPRFPAPSHVIPPSQIALAVGAPDHPWVNVQAQEDDASSLVLTHDNKWIPSSPAAWDADNDDHWNRDLVQEALENLLLVQQEETPTSSGTVAGTLWSSKYGHHHNLHNLVGESAQTAARTLQAWIDDWCLARQRSMNRMKERQQQLSRTKKKTKKTIYKDDSEDDWDDDDDDDITGRLAKVYLLTGPPASGKTGLVHAVAKAAGCSVLEINTTMVRSASALKHSVQEATQSCSTMDLFQRQSQLSQSQDLLDSSSSSSSSSDDDEDASPGRKCRNRPKASLTVILIDEVDLVYDTDAGFWPALTSLAKTAKCPILLTATTVPPPMLTIPSCVHMVLTRPTPAECATKLLQLCQQEGLALTKGGGTTNSSIQERLEWLATVGQCDLRKILLQLQLFHYHHNTNSSSRQQQRSLEKPSSLLLADTNASASPTIILQRPVLQSVVPHVVPSDKYSIVTLYGQHFKSLLVVATANNNASRDLTVYLGSLACRAHVVDDESILVLCPPFDGDTGDGVSSRILTIGLHSTVFGQLDGVSTKVETLPDGSLLPGTKRMYVEYLFPEGNDQVDDNSADEFEMDDGNARTPMVPSAVHKLSTGCRIPSPEEGLALWQKTLQEEVVCAESTPAPIPPISKHSQVKNMEELAQATCWSSDAAFLEDMQYGVPYLSGACRGFGFDLTEQGGAPTGSGKFRMSDNCRPPSEDRLFATGWKDNCFFHGVAETYMTLPRNAQERKSLNDGMVAARGGQSSMIELTVAPADKEDDSSDNWEDNLRTESNTTEEDMFLPRRLPILLEALPQLLRISKCSAWYNSNWTSNHFLDQRRHETTTRLQFWLSALFDQSLQSTKYKARPTSRELLQLNGRLDVTATTEFLPMICRIGALEESLDALERSTSSEERAAPGNSRRATRLQTRNARRHYFDTISRKLDLDEAALSTTDLGLSMARSLLTYQGAAVAAAGR